MVVFLCKIVKLSHTFGCCYKISVNADSFDVSKCNTIHYTCTEFVIKVKYEALVISEVKGWLPSRRPSMTSSTRGVLRRLPTGPMPSSGSVLRWFFREVMDVTNMQWRNHRGIDRNMDANYRNIRHPSGQLRLKSTSSGSLCPCLRLLDIHSFLAGFKLLVLPVDSILLFQPMAVPKIDTSRVSVVRGEGSCLTGSK